MRLLLLIFFLFLISNFKLSAQTDIAEVEQKVMVFYDYVKKYSEASSVDSIAIANLYKNKIIKLFDGRDIASVYTACNDVSNERTDMERLEPSVYLERLTADSLYNFPIIVKDSLCVSKEGEDFLVSFKTKFDLPRNGPCKDSLGRIGRKIKMRKVASDDGSSEFKILTIRFNYEEFSCVNEYIKTTSIPLSLPITRPSTPPPVRQPEPILDTDSTSIDCSSCEQRVAKLESDSISLANTIGLKDSAAKASSEEIENLKKDNRRQDSINIELSGLLKAADDTIELKNIAIEDLTIENEKLVEDHDKAVLEKQLIEDEYDFFKDSISDILKIAKKDIQSVSNRHEESMRATEQLITDYERFNYNKAMFIGLNYNVLSQSDVLVGQTYRSRFISPSRIKLSVYHHVGFFVSNVKISRKTTPLNHYTLIDIQRAKEDLFLQDITPEDLVYNTSDENLSTIDFGLNIRTPFNGVYAMLGISQLNGGVWDYYTGDLSPVIEPIDGGYILDYREFNNYRGAITGITYLRPRIQFDVGYNFVYDDFFVNMGFNVPIGKLVSDNSSKGISRERRRQKFLAFFDRFNPDKTSNKVFKNEKQNKKVNGSKNNVRKAQEATKQRIEKLKEDVNYDTVNEVSKEAKKRSKKKNRKPKN